MIFSFLLFNIWYCIQSQKNYLKQLRFQSNSNCLRIVLDLLLQLMMWLFFYCERRDKGGQFNIFRFLKGKMNVNRNKGCWEDSIWHFIVQKYHSWTVRWGFFLIDANANDNEDKVFLMISLSNNCQLRYNKTF